MKRLTLAAFLILASASLVAGTTYDFRSDTTGLQQTSIDGTVAVDGPNLKMTVSTGDGKRSRSRTVQQRQVVTMLAKGRLGKQHMHVVAGFFLGYGGIAQLSFRAAGSE